MPRLRPEAPLDTHEIDQVIAAFFAAFDNRGSAAPGLAALPALFLPGAIIVKRASGVAESMTVDQFIAPRAALLTGGRLVDFHEWETEAETSLADGLALRVSRYRKAGLMDGAAMAGGGRKHTSLVRTNAGWRIASVTWEDDA